MRQRGQVQRPGSAPPPGPQLSPDALRQNQGALQQSRGVLRPSPVPSGRAPVELVATSTGAIPGSSHDRGRFPARPRAAAIAAHHEPPFRRTVSVGTVEDCAWQVSTAQDSARATARPSTPGPAQERVAQGQDRSGPDRSGTESLRTGATTRRWRAPGTAPAARTRQRAGRTPSRTPSSPDSPAPTTAAPARSTTTRSRFPHSSRDHVFPRTEVSTRAPRT